MSGFPKSGGMEYVRSVYGVPAKRGGRGDPGVDCVGGGMKERPILFSGPMVRAILEGRKTQTRRVCPDVPCGWSSAVRRLGGGFEFLPYKDSQRGIVVDCPYGQPGDRLWVRESLKFDPDSGWLYMADGETCDSDMMSYSKPSCPSIHMPRWASRITLEITGVRVERVRDITDQDAMAEGVEQKKITARSWLSGETEVTRVGKGVVVDAPHKTAFKLLWNSINAKRGYGWDANPFVWVVEFVRVK